MYSASHCLSHTLLRAGGTLGFTERPGRSLSDPGVKSVRSARLRSPPGRRRTSLCLSQSALKQRRVYVSATDVCLLSGVGGAELLHSGTTPPYIVPNVFMRVLMRVRLHMHPGNTCAHRAAPSQSRATDENLFLITK